LSSTLTELPRIDGGVDRRRRLEELDPDQRRRRPPGAECQGLLDQSADVKGPLLGPGRPGEIQERLHEPLEPVDLLLQYVQVAAAQPRSGPGVRAGHLGRGTGRGTLHEELHRGQRVAQLVGHAGRQLADRRQLFGPEDLVLLLLQALDDRPDPLADQP
jgi:hypothetical protein